MRSNALPPPRRSPLQSPSWPATRPPSSQAPPWPSTAAARSTDLDRAPPETEEKSMTLTPERIVADRRELRDRWYRSEEHTSELQSLMRISYAVFCLKKKKQINDNMTRCHD